MEGNTSTILFIFPKKKKETKEAIMLHNIESTNKRKALPLLVQLSSY